MRKTLPQRPTIEEMERELRRVKYRRRYRRVLRSTVYTLVTVAAVAVLVATLWLPVLQTHGESMSPTLQDGNIIVSVKDSNYECGDIIAFYYNNKVIVRRVVATGNNQVSIDVFGTVSVNGKELEEPYVENKTLGQCNLSFPYNVPTNSFFVLGDNRDIAMDSRLAEIGVVTEDRLIGKVVFSIHPFGSIK